MGITIHGSTNDFSSETTIGTAYTSLHYSSINSNAQYVNGSCNVLFNCSDITTHKVRFKTNSVDTTPVHQVLLMLLVLLVIYTLVFYFNV